MKVYVFKIENIGYSQIPVLTLQLNYCQTKISSVSSESKNMKKKKITRKLFKINKIMF